MKIAIDTIPLLSPFTGVGNYTYQIARNLKKLTPHHEYTYFYGYYSPNLIAPGEHPKSFYRLKEAVKKIPFWGTAARNWKDWGNYLSSRRFDLYFEPNFVPLKIPAKHTVATVFDFSFARFPEWHSKDKVRYFQKRFWKNIKKAERIICISDFIRHEATSLYGFAPEKLTTIHLGVDNEIFRTYLAPDLQNVRVRYNLPDNFILFVGSIEPRKNLKALLDAYQELEGNLRKEYKLVLVGFKGWENDEVMKRIRKLKEDVSYIGYVPESDLAKIYNRARLSVYPSLYEGFGLPPLEAMACGCPVIVSNAASLPEVCGEAAFYVNPEDAESITLGIRKVLLEETLRRSLSTKGLDRARQFSWGRAASEHLRVFQEVAQAGQG